MRQVVSFEQEPGSQSAEVPRMRICMVRCLDWLCDDFGMLAPIEIERDGDKEPAVWCPNRRAGCPLP